MRGELVYEKRRTPLSNLSIFLGTIKTSENNREEYHHPLLLRQQGLGKQGTLSINPNAGTKECFP